MSDTHPSFSILVETANLDEAELASLRICLSSLAAQTVSPQDAEEVILLESGGVPDSLLRQLTDEFPWLTVSHIDTSNYGDVKAQGGKVGTGEIVVLCDADCRYRPDWLQNMLAPFADRDDVEIVAGETTTPIEGAYGLAIALSFVFPRLSGETELSAAKWYWANNAAFRRRVLGDLPLEEGMPLFRGQTIPHGRALRRAGYRIWRQPRAVAIHDLPLASELPRRYFLKGHDAQVISELMDDGSDDTFLGGMEPGQAPGGRGGETAKRLRSVVAEDPRRAVLLPLAAPILLLAGGAYLAGRTAAAVGRSRRRGSRARSPVAHGR